MTSIRLDMVMPLDAPQPTFVVPNISQIPDTDEDRPISGGPLNSIGTLNLSSLVFGCGAFSNQYNDDGMITSVQPLRTVRLALRYGIRAFDTSAYYGPSEIVLGAALKAISDEFPRSSYQLMTKCGRYGVNDFDYSPATIRKSVERSLQRLNTPYLDTVFLHDVEFVAERVTPRATGNHLSALDDQAELYGLAEGQKAKIWGEGDEKVLAAMAELRKMQEEGLIKHVGITGFPLPTLLRLATLFLHTPPYKPIDVLLSYSHSNLQNDAFRSFVPHFVQRAKISQLLSASPFSMGLLTDHMPAWHPAPPALKQTVSVALENCKDWPGGLADVALGYSMRREGGIQDLYASVPTVVGLSSLHEVHEAVKVFREVQANGSDETRKRKEDETRQLFIDAGFGEWSWASP